MWNPSNFGPKRPRVEWQLARSGQLPEESVSARALNLGSVTALGTPEVDRIWGI